jgi:ABC-2 type transport system permease protein/oleandomycin transport system permease protein
MRFLRDPANVAGSTVQPIMFILMFRYVLGGAIEVQGSYADFLVPGALAMATAFGSATTAIGLAEDLNAGMIDRFRSMPVARSAVLAGRLLFDLMKYTMLVLLMLAIGYLVGFRFSNGVFPALAMMGMALLFGVSASCVSAYLGMQIRKPEAVLAFGFLWMFPVTFISSAFVPVVFMPGWLQAVAKANPVSIIIESMRAMALGGPIEVKAIESLAWIVGIMCVAAPMAVHAYRKAS